MLCKVVAMLWLAVFTMDVESKIEKGGRCPGLELVGREEWGARPTARDWTMITPVNHVIIQHTVTHFSRTPNICVRNIQFIQDFHLDERGWWDIAYNFLVCGDGRVYEGRGWNRTGAHSINFNTRSVGIAFVGNFNTDRPTQAMLDATLRLIDCGVKLGFLTPSREIHGHRDVSCTESPGSHLYEVIRQWKGYKGGRLPLYNCDVLQWPTLSKDIIAADPTTQPIL